MFSRFIKEQKGQTIGLFPIVALVLVVAVFFVYNIGNYYYDYMREQNAIDAAVYSGAAMQADALNMIVIINKSLLTIYGLSITFCLVGIVASFFTGGAAACPFCKGAGITMSVVEKAALVTMEMVNKGSLGFSAAAMDIYKQSGGKAKKPFVNYLVTVSTLKLEKVYWDKFLRPGCPAFFWPKRTFMGMVEKKTDGVYDWAGGRTTKPYVYGTFGQPKKGKSGGRYDKKGPGVVGYAKIKFVPAASWFKKYKRNIYVAAQARPYGGNIGTALKTQNYSRKETKTTGTGDKEKKETESYSKPPQAFPIPWGKASFKAKLVPIGY